MTYHDAVALILALAFVVLVIGSLVILHDDETQGEREEYDA